MPAPDLIRLCNHDEIMEAAFVDWIEGAGLDVIGSRSLEDRPDAMIEVTFEPGGDVDHQATPAISGTGFREYDWFTGSLQVIIQTDRQTDRKSSLSGIRTKHAERVARVRARMLQGPLLTGFTSAYFDLVTIRFLGQARAADDAFDQSTLQWSLQYRIRQDAWPTA